MGKQIFTAALVLSVMVPALAQGQEAMSPPPPGPYQAMNLPAMPAMPGGLESPETAQMPEPVTPSASQIWGRPAMMQLPYWMQMPGAPIDQQNRRQAVRSPDANPDARGGGDAETMQLSPADRPTAPTIVVPRYGVGLTPGFFPGYGARQDGAAQVQMEAGAGPASQAQAGNRGRYGYGGVQPYPAYQPYPYFPGQMQMPYWYAPVWAMPMAPAYPYPPQANRWEQR